MTIFTYLGGLLLDTYNMEIVPIRIKFLDQFIQNKPLVYKTPESSGMDICSTIDVNIDPLHRYLIPCGISVEIPIGYEIQVRSRSGLAINNGVMVLNSPGTIDSDYRGEIKVILMNFGDAVFTVNKGDRIAQMVLCKIAQMKLQSTNDLTETNRGNGGFGSTGV